jgi:hypothetical protein
MFTAMTMTFMPLLAPTNQMVYDTVQFYNGTVAIVAGIGTAMLSFRLLPPLSPAYRARRLLALTLRDLRRLATGRTRRDWDGHVGGRLLAMPDAATPLQRAQLLAALSVQRDHSAAPDYAPARSRRGGRARNRTGNADRPAGARQHSCDFGNTLQCMPPTSGRGCSGEVHGDKPVWRLCRSDVVDDGYSLGS